ncbi:protein SEMI-ROLLED LEAF 2 isoform X1 [Corylus avellana]|uniref:protein SEMI-ROLLED LEAF 2 isoform X1 n=2 Tax=Corylus avellana TaxID=13451 RepID=UPI00286D0D08|nr:protein SEMI-ROLLED LEAF 2 isoform X1 [Corylus avellana]XP_059446363.1 protein SEMI-ROLLED LEAF 2 isoform X1 [Corylus avellana]
MGVMSRRVVPACGNLCFFCPSMRARSRQPVKRYKKLLSDILKDAEPNERKIGKLCEYASKNPLRIPKITNQLEQRCYKDLRNENFGSLKVVLRIYGKLLSSCKEQMPLFASSLLGIVRILLEQTRQDEMQISGCSILVDFINRQIDSTYMFNLEGLIPKLCNLAQEVGDNERALRLRSAGLQALAFMVWFMGEHSHISMDFDNIISVTLDNYMDLQINSKNAKKDGLYSESQDPWVQEEHGSYFPNISKMVSSVPNIMTNPHLDSTKDNSKSPAYWSRVCLHNMARLAKEATTVRRVLEPLFHSFDVDNHWSPEKGVAFSVLTYFQSLLEESGDNSHLLLSILVKHLDHKNVVKQPLVQINIVNVTTQLAKNAKQQASVAIIGAISDLIKHLRKCLQNLSEASSPRGATDKWNTDLHLALAECLSQLSIKVGDAGPILDMMAVVLENIPATTLVARTTISAVLQTAKIISSIPNVSYQKKAFPEALFHQLLLAMSHPDPQTRVGAHSVFSMVLMPSLLCPCLDQNLETSQAVSRFSSIGTTQTVRSGSFSIQDEGKDATEPPNVGLRDEVIQISDVGFKQSGIDPPCDQSYNFKYALTDGKTELTCLRLSSHQISLLLSSIWVQATSAENTPANFVAMAHAYNIALLFTRSKTSSHPALVRCFQLAFSLRSISLDQEGGLQPSRRRSLFTLASSMLIFSARAGSLVELIPLVKESLTDKTVDPYLELVDNIRLQAVSIESDKEMLYGSQEDEVAALKSLSAIELDDQQLKETVISHFMSKSAKLSEDELSSIKKQLSEGFSPDDAYPLGPPLFMETPRPSSPLAQMEFPDFDEVTGALTDEEAFPEPSGSQSGRRTSLSINSLDIISVNQLLESVLETARQVASVPVSSTPIPYDQMKSQCEALVTGKQRKMSVLHSFKNQNESKAIVICDENEKKCNVLPAKTLELSNGDMKLINQEPIQGHDQLLLCSLEYQQHSFRLPPSSPYDKFLKAAGC